MRILVQICRILTGGLFIFSGIIKANDTLGFSYKLKEYFEVFGTEWMIPASTVLAMFICVFEIVLGFMLLIGYKPKLTLWLSLLMIVFFTFLTFYSAYFNKVTHCGCFGDFLQLTPWQSFYKDIALLIMIIILFIGIRYIKPIFNSTITVFLMFLAVIAAVAFPLYTYQYLPIWDFRPYKIGANICKDRTGGIPDEQTFFYKLKNKKTGEEKEFTSWPENWDAEWDYISNRTEVTKKGVPPKIVDFSIMDLEGNDYTEDILNKPGVQFFLVAYDLKKADKDEQGNINDFYELCKKDSISFICLTASGKDKIDAFKQETGAAYEFYNTDEIALKTMIRSNPGLMLLKDCEVKDMWHHNSLPSYNDVKEKYFK